MALADARRKAEEYAKAAGMELGEVVQIKEQKPDGGESRDSSQKSSATDEQDFRASVSVTYAAGPPSRGEKTIKTRPAPEGKR
jgi:uncharacterized protein YggE